MKVVSKIFLVSTFCTLLLASSNAFASFEAKEREFLERVAEVLPLPLKKTLKSTPISFKKLPWSGNPCEEGSQIGQRNIYGSFHFNEMTLNKKLAKLFHENPPLSCEHETGQKFAMATVIHEVVHAWEAKNFSFQKPSRSREYVYLTHAKKNLLGVIKILNHKKSRSPDPYELTHIEEHFAVNAEYFFLDDTYGCRRPNLYQYFSMLFSFYPPRNCQTHRQLNITVSGKNRLFNLDPSWVREIHYVRSGEGEKAMSKFGHAGFRFVLCRPEASLKECRGRNSQHLYFNFVAQIDGLTINNLRGLKGDYPIKMEVRPFQEALKDYTELQERHVYAYPLKLSEEQKERFIHQALTLYWEYSGRYYFLSKNCATEAFRLLKVVFRDQGLTRKIKVTPKSVMRALQKENLLEEEILFNSRTDLLERLFNKAMGESRAVSRAEYAKLSFEERESLRESIISSYKQTGENDDEMVFSWIAIEKHLIKIKMELWQNELAKKLMDLPSDHPMSQLASELTKIENEIKYGSYLKKGYGIPLKREVSEDSRGEELLLKLKELKMKLNIWGEAELPELSLEIENSLKSFQRLFI